MVHAWSHGCQKLVRAAEAGPLLSPTPLSARGRCALQGALQGAKIQAMRIKQVAA